MNQFTYKPIILFFLSITSHIIYVSGRNITTCCRIGHAETTVAEFSDCKGTRKVSVHQESLSGPKGSDSIPCDFCFTEMTFDGPTQYLQGCGIKSMAKETFNDKYGTCKVIDKDKNKKTSGITPHGKPNVMIVQCACQDKDTCNREKPAKTYGRDWPKEVKGSTKCCGKDGLLNNEAVNEREASSCSSDFQITTCNKCLLVYDINAEKFSQGCLRKEANPKAPTPDEEKAKKAFKELFNVRGDGIDRCNLIEGVTGIEANFKALKMTVADAKPLITCSCSGELCNRYAGFAKFNRKWAEFKPTPATTTTTTTTTTSTTPKASNGTIKKEKGPRPSSKTTPSSNFAEKIVFTWPFPTFLIVICNMSIS